VPLDAQDVRFWSQEMMDDAERALAAAARLNRIGRFQIEAAIQSAHAQRANGSEPAWPGIALLYDALVRFSPTIGAFVGRAAAVAEARGTAAGFSLMEEIPIEAVSSYQPYWALRGHLLRRLDRSDDANAAYSRAAGLSEDSAVREFLLSRIGR
jgi:RNA polymerase sigma-70 factor (ECF subfamily)